MYKNLEAAKYAAMMGINDGLDVYVSVWDTETLTNHAKFPITDYSQLSMIKACCKFHEADIWEINYTTYSVDIILLYKGFEGVYGGL